MLWINFNGRMVNFDRHICLYRDEKLGNWKITLSYDDKHAVAECFDTEQARDDRYAELSKKLDNNEWAESYIIALEKQVNFLTNELALRKTYDRPDLSNTNEALRTMRGESTNREQENSEVPRVLGT